MDGCGKPASRLSLCDKHYRRLKRNGDPNILQKAPYGEPARWLVANKGYSGDECLIWPFGRGKSGYGHDIIFNGERGTPHRIMCQLANGDPPIAEIRFHAAHSCGRGKQGCVSPKHLRWATPIENSADAAKHEQAARGERQWRAKVTESDVRAIRALRGVISQANVGKRFGISTGAVNNIQCRRTWSHVT